MHDIVVACEQHSPVSDQVLAILDFHFHYGVGAVEKEGDLIKWIGDLGGEHRLVH
jgi:hypothetical protein